jgi:hypothetical protein
MQLINTPCIGGMHTILHYLGRLAAPPGRAATWSPACYCYCSAAAAVAACLMLLPTSCNPSTTALPAALPSALPPPVTLLVLLLPSNAVSSDKCGWPSRSCATATDSAPSSREWPAPMQVFSRQKALDSQV